MHENDDEKRSGELREPGNLTRALRGALEVESDDRGEIYQLVILELRRIAQSALRRSPGNACVQVTQLVNEAWLKLAHHHPTAWSSRDHFQAWSSRAVRSILVDQARARHALKRGAAEGATPLTESIAVQGGPAFDLMALDDALRDLEQVDPKGSQITELCYFGGLTQQQAAEVLGIDLSTVKRRWRMARGWLEARLGDDTADA